MGKVIAYLRVSTEEQTKGFGLKEQRDKLEAYCYFKSWQMVEWIEDAGFSGGNTNRPGLLGLLNAVRSGEVSVVLTYKADRLSRSLKDLLVLIEDELEPRGVAFVSATEDFNTNTASGKAFLSMLGTFAEFERNTIRERTLGGRKQKARSGGYAAGSPAIGYIADGKQLVVSNDEAVVVRNIFLMHSEGYALRAIAEELNKSKVKTKRGGQWYASTVRYILENSKYQGVLRQSFKDEYFETNKPELNIIEF
jgi:DNA invertase Pin-like site-specific DNA recombinase